MTILFLQGRSSVVGGVKPTFRCRDEERQRDKRHHEIQEAADCRCLRKPRVQAEQQSVRLY